jgi:hypothetical protein
MYFDALLTRLGVAKLYQENKDISDLTAEIISKKSTIDVKLFGEEPR